MLTKKLQLFETVKFENGVAKFLHFHNKRCNFSRKKLFDSMDNLDLKDYISSVPKIGKYRVKIIYSKEIIDVQYSNYKERSFRKFKIVENNNISYDFKFLNRDFFNSLLLKYRDKNDEILIIKNGYITDISIANVAFLQNGNWLTPSTPLLKGTTRERLLESGKIKESNLKLKDLKNGLFEKMAIMNALIGFHEIKDLELEF